MTVMKPATILASFIVCLFTWHASATESIDAVQRALDAAAGKVRSLACVQREVTDAKMSEDGGLRSDGTGILEFQRSGGKTQWREELKGTQIQKAGGQESRLDFDTVKFDDGERNWMVLESGGKKTAYKLKMRETRPVLADKNFFDALGANNALAVLADETVDGRKCVALEATPKMFVGKLKPGQAVTLYYIHTDTGVIVKVVSHDVQGRPMVTTTRTQIKIGAAIPAERFKPPPGAEINDMSK